MEKLALKFEPSDELAIMAEFELEEEAQKEDSIFTEFNAIRRLLSFIKEIHEKYPAEVEILMQKYRMVYRRENGTIFGYKEDKNVY